MPLIDSSSLQIAARQALGLRLLSGESVAVDVGGSDTVRDVKERAATALGVPAPFLRLFDDTHAKAEELANHKRMKTSAAKNRQLSLLVLSRVEFVTHQVPPGSLVLVDGVLATLSYYESRRGHGICFEFKPPGHPRFQKVFRATNWSNPEPGIIEYQTYPISGYLEVSWVMESQVPEVLDQGSEEQWAHLVWYVTGIPIPVSASIEPHGDHVGLLEPGTRLIVQEAHLFANLGRENTPRLRITVPLHGWVTPYEVGDQHALVLPSTEAAWAAEGVLKTIADRAGARQ